MRTPETSRPLWSFFAALVLAAFGLNWLWEMVQMPAYVEKYTDLSYGQQYTCHLKGNTLVDISPREDRPSWTNMGSDDGATFPVKYDENNAAS